MKTKKELEHIYNIYIYIYIYVYIVLEYKKGANNVEKITRA